MHARSFVALELSHDNDNVDVAMNTLNVELHKISNWLLSNKLSINVHKSNYIIFSSRQNKYTCNTNLSFMVLF